MVEFCRCFYLLLFASCPCVLFRFWSAKFGQLVSHSTFNCCLSCEVCGNMWQCVKGLIRFDVLLAEGFIIYRSLASRRSLREVKTKMYTVYIAHIAPGDLFQGKPSWLHEWASSTAVAQGCQPVKHDETSGTCGDENVKGAWGEIVQVRTGGCLRSQFWTMKLPNKFLSQSTCQQV